jgi:molybdopterin-synthase adenylyltransferase
MTYHEIDYLQQRELAVAMTGDLDAELRHHFAHEGIQEDLTFAIWRPSLGNRRMSFVLDRALLPDKEERILEGNVSFTSDYLSRVLASLKPGTGIALIHSHLGPGWQGMSEDDIVAERDRLASAASGRSGLPLLGMTWGTDGTWSARAWGRAAPFTYERVEIPVVRVVASDRLSLSFHPLLRPEPAELPAQVATVSVWGAAAQADIARARVGLVGLGSVGSLIAEGLSRMGVSDIVLIDHDRIELRNLDRTLHSILADVEAQSLKVDVAARGIADSHTAEGIEVNKLPTSLLTQEGIEAALDCDVLFSCVDRPFPRWILNAIAYAHLIPVIDGGIFARTTPEGRPLHIDWRIHSVGPGRACMVCLGALLRSDVGLDRDGLLDDPDYIAGLNPAERERYSRRNVFPFSLAVAGHQILHFAGMIAGSARVSGIGPQHYQAYPGEMAVEPTARCHQDCDIDALVASAQALTAQFS